MHVKIESYDQMKFFLLNKDCLFCYSNSSLDLSNLANMYDMKIAIFTDSSGGSLVPHWTWVYPDPYINTRSQYKNKSLFREMWLYHEDNVHYDLLVNRPTPLPASYSYVPMSAPSSDSITAPSSSQPSSCSSSTDWMSSAAHTKFAFLGSIE
jgi:hypothetical protein